MCFKMAGNGLPLAAAGDLEAQNCQPAQKFDRSTNLQLTTSAPVAANGCYSQFFFYRS
jgi:hypothetical protein